MSASMAEKSFNENRQLFGNPQSSPEKYNLYNGLANLAAAVQQLERKVDNIEHMIRQLR